MRFAHTLLPVAAILAMTAANAEEPSGFEAGSVLIRARAIDVVPDVSSTVTPLRGSAKVSDNAVPEVDLSYFFTRNISAELIAAVTYHTVKDENSIAGTLPLGSVRLLPPTLTAQWHFLPDSMVNPYVGAGVNYTFFYGVKKSPLPIVYSTHYSNNFGEALQAGADIHLSGRWYANIDVKKVFLHTDVSWGTALGHVSAKVDLDPWIVGAGIGYRF